MAPTPAGPRRPSPRGRSRAAADTGPSDASSDGDRSAGDGPPASTRPAVPSSRRERPGRHVDKARTRRALLDGALQLLWDRSLDNLGIREVTRAAGVAPAAFYRHFDTVDELGVVLVDEAFATLRKMMRDARDDVVAADDMIKRSVTVLVRHIHDHRRHFRFIAREMFSPVAPVRHAIRTELRLFSTELATDLARLPGMEDWSVPDLVMLADLIVDLMTNFSYRLLEAIEEDPSREPTIIAETERRLRYLTLGATVWHPDR